MSIKGIVTKAFVNGNYFLFKHLPERTYPTLVKLYYRIQMNVKLNLEKPTTLTEKIQWLKLYDSTPEKTRLADKYLVRDWIKETIGEKYLIPLLGVWERFEDIDFNTLPDKFALKCNHGSACNIIVTDKAKLDLADAQKKFQKWLNTNYAYFSGELHYKTIKPLIIAEKYIENVGGLQDYRFYCFNGEPKMVWLDVFSGTPNHKRNIYDMNWKPIPVKCKWPARKPDENKKPACFDEMVSLAKIMSHDFCFVRVDFYEVDGKVYFGEMTFTPMSGEADFEPKEYNKTFGDMLILPKVEN